MAIPNESHPLSAVTMGKCQRCNEEEATLLIRSDNVCQTCFITYINTKVVKRMETYKPRGSTMRAPRRLLLALSYGPASTVLLHMLDASLQAQFERMAKTSYSLVVVHVSSEDSIAGSSTRLEKLRARYSRHEFVSCDLERSIDEHVSETPDGSESSPLSVNMDELHSATARADIRATMLTRRLVAEAKKHACTTILYGHSTTRLAEKVLTATAAGRGFSLPWQVSDGPTPYGVDFAYPLRDVLSKEVVMYSRLAGLEDLIAYESRKEVSVSSKNTTIDELMAQYFASVEENYPSIVANVVRTSNKLMPPRPATTSTACQVCALPVEKGTDGINGWAGDQNVQEHEDTVDATADILCYGCARSVND